MCKNISNIFLKLLQKDVAVWTVRRRQKYIMSTIQEKFAFSLNHSANISKKYGLQYKLNSYKLKL